MLVLEAMNLPSLFFVGTVVAEGLRASGRFATRGLLLPSGQALGGFFVQQSRLRRTPTLIGKPRHPHGAFVKALADTQRSEERREGKGEERGSRRGAQESDHRARGHHE